MHGTRRAEGQSLAQSFFDPVRTETEDDDLAAGFLGDLQRLLDGMLVALVDHVPQIFLVEPAAVLADPEACLGVGNLFDTHSDIHRDLLKLESGTLHEPDPAEAGITRLRGSKTDR